MFEKEKFLSFSIANTYVTYCFYVLYGSFGLIIYLIFYSWF